MAELEEYGTLLLGSRLRRLCEQLYSGVDEIYRAHGVRQSSSLFPLLFLLRDVERLPIRELARRLGITHAAVVQMGDRLLRDGLLHEAADLRDKRKRMLVVSKKGRETMEQLQPVWRALVAAVDELAAETERDLAATVSAYETALAGRGFAERIGAQLSAAGRAAVEIIDFEPRHREAFQALNLPWLQKHFTVEKIDEQVLSQPEKHILAPGGFIFYARLGDEIVGTCALIRHPRGRYEVSKMAVSEQHRGLGIGRKLLERVVAQFHKVRGKQLFLESNKKLTPALKLYETSGFRHVPRPKGPSPYQRSDVYMVYEPPVSRAIQRRHRR